MAIDQNTSGQDVTNVQLQAQVSTYKATRNELSANYPEIASALPDACSVQLSVLEDFIAYAKKALFQQGVIAPGIGFVFAQYGAPSSDPLMNPAYEGKIHVVLKAIDLGQLDALGTSGTNFSPSQPNAPMIRPMNYMNISPPKAPIVVL